MDRKLRSASQSRKRNDDNPYEAIAFGDFGTYMDNKKKKLKIQNNDLKQESPFPQLLKGCIIHINGNTEGIDQWKLRELIVKHGGDYVPYLSRKRSVTHIVASNLTYKKLQEFSAYKVAQPQWLLDSFSLGKLLDWSAYSLHRTGGLNFEKQRYDPPPVIDLARDPDDEDDPETESVYSEFSELEPNCGTDSINGGSDWYLPQNSMDTTRQRLLDPEFRAKHTAMNPNFLEGYFKASRLHHLSTWKADLISDVCKQQRHLANSPLLAARDRIIMHVDFDCFFASAALINRPELCGRPLVVCHASSKQAVSTSEIASSSYEARSFGIRNGISLGRAQEMCPDVVPVPFEFELYKELSDILYKKLFEYSLFVQAVSVDEATVQVAIDAHEQVNPSSLHGTNAELISRYSHAQKYYKVLAHACKLQKSILESTGCYVSIGIGHNILQARLASRQAKPRGVYYLVPEDVLEFLIPLPVDQLPGFGYSTLHKLSALRIRRVADLKDVPISRLVDALGQKTADKLAQFSQGIDDRPLELDHVRKTVSAEVNYGVRFDTQEQALFFLGQLVQETHRRLAKTGMSSKLLTLKVLLRAKDAPIEPRKVLGHGPCDVISQSTPIASSSLDTCLAEARNLFLALQPGPIIDIRGMGIAFTKTYWDSQPAVNAKQKTLNWLTAKEEDKNVASPAPLPMPPRPRLSISLKELSRLNIDPSFFNEIEDDTLRREIVEVARRNLTRVPTKAQSNLRSAFKAGKKGTASSAPPPTEKWRPFEMPDSLVKHWIPDVDVKVFRQLPLDIQQEQLEQSATARKIAPPPVESGTSHRSLVMRQESSFMTRQDSAHLRTPQGVRDMLTSWVDESFSQDLCLPPSADKVIEVDRILLKLVDSDVSLVYLAMKWWVHLIDSHSSKITTASQMTRDLVFETWRAAWADTREKINAAVIARFGYPLALE